VMLWHLMTGQMQVNKTALSTPRTVCLGQTLAVRVDRAYRQPTTCSPAPSVIADQAVDY